MKKRSSILIFILFFAIGSIWGKKYSSSEETISVKEVIPFVYCGIKQKGPYTEIPNVIQMLMSVSRSQNIFPSGAIFGIYYNSPGEVKAEDLEWEIGFPVTPQVFAQAPLELKRWNYTTVVCIIHSGSYEEIGNTILKMFKWMEENNLSQDGPLLERYLTMPSPEIQPQNLKTEIWIPCKKK